MSEPTLQVGDISVTLDEIHMGLDHLDAVWEGGAWCDPLTGEPIHSCADCRPLEAKQP